MKKVIAILLVLVSTMFIVSNAKGQVKASQQTIAKKIIRFHVIANSDTEKDQKLKLKIRDQVLKYIAPRLKKSKNIQQSKKILQDNDAVMKNIALQVIKKNGYRYNVVTTLRQDDFPVKQYGNITLPEGRYEAYRIVIGTGNGHNWWCVMFPPLCFVDITKGEVAYTQTKKEMQQVLTPDEYKLVDNTNSNKKSNKVVIKFKIAEVLKNIFN